MRPLYFDLQRFYSAPPASFSFLAQDSIQQRIKGSKINASSSSTFKAMLDANDPLDREKWPKSELTLGRLAAIFSEIGAMKKNEAETYTSMPHLIITKQRIDEVLDSAGLDQMKGEFNNDVSFKEFYNDFQKNMILRKVAIEQKLGIICGGYGPPSDVDVMLFTGVASRH